MEQADDENQKDAQDDDDISRDKNEVRNFDEDDGVTDEIIKASWGQRDEPADDVQAKTQMISRKNSEINVEMQMDQEDQIVSDEKQEEYLKLSK